MKKVKFYTLFALLLIAGGMTMQAQEPQRFFERHYIDDLIFMNEKDLLVLGADEAADVALYKVDENGELINRVVLPSIQDNNSLRHLVRFGDGSVGLFVTKYSNDTIHLQKMTVHEDLSVDTMDFNWVGYDFYRFISGGEQWVEDALGNFYYSYYVDTLWTSGHHGLRILKFDGNGELLTERLLDDPAPSSSGCYMFPTPDMMGCRLVLAGNGGGSIYNCYTLDGDLNTIAIKENIDQLSYPMRCGWIACFRMNPYNGKTYTINMEDEVIPTPSGYIVVHNEDVLMSVFDADNFEQLAYTWGITSEIPCTPGKPNSIDFGENGDVYMASGMDKPDNWYFSKSLYIVHLDEDLNKLQEIYYKEDGTELMYFGGLRLNSNGDVFISCQVAKSSTTGTTGAIFKVPKEAFDGIEEAHDAGFAVAVAYPNPGGNTLNIRTVLQNAHLEVYDLNGRLIHSQAITENVTTVDTGNWAEGVYVWKVISNGKEAESGKWVKK
ncbi:MAG: T9SS type A sorting domain-containing protein [Bacteroidales bacterium]|nr:T9SS type A sorting domain-containing protein [Bacteroidales bacterium]